MKNYNKVKFYADAVETQDLPLEEAVATYGRTSAVRRKKYLNFETWKEVQKAKRLLEKKHRIIKTSTNERPTAGESYVPGIHNEETPFKIEDRWGENEENFAGLKEPMPFIDPSSITVAE